MVSIIQDLEGFCSTSCFVILFLTTIFYWVKTFFLGEIASSVNGLVGYIIAFVFLTIHLLLRWLDSGHFPLSNLYESLLFLAWCLIFISIYIEKSTKTFFLGVLTAPTLLCLVSFAEFSLPLELQQSHSLVPALQSNWLVMHVTVMIASYAALLLGCLVSISYLVFFHWFPESQTLKNREIHAYEKTSFFQWHFNFFLTNFGLKRSKAYEKTKFFQLVDLSASPVDILPIDFEKSKNLQKQKPDFKLPTNKEFLLSGEKKDQNHSLSYQDKTALLSFLDNLSYRTIGVGFCFLTLGILSGAVWANESWGTYWSWDPKETWALITWLTFAIYLHSRFIGGWQGYKPAFIGSFGFCIIWVCYLGVNIFGQGLHSYGFLQI